MRYTTATPATGGSRGDRAQYPDTTAYMAVEAMVKKLNGETAPEKTITDQAYHKGQRVGCRQILQRRIGARTKPRGLPFTSNWRLLRELPALILH
jgi:hypothetical protein